MSEKLISEKWLRDYLDGYDAKVLEPAALQLLNNFYAELTNAPAVDAVAVVRCKDCKSYLPENHNFAKHCQLTGTEMDKDGFCSYGERREENAVD